MLQKVFKYILIIGVVMIWGIVIYKVISSQKVVALPLQLTQKPSQSVTEFNSFSLNADYPDPFLHYPEADSVLQSIEVPSPTKQASTSVIPKPDLSFIQFHGIISNPSKKKQIALVEINGKQLLISEKEHFENILFLKFTKDKLTVVVKWQKKRDFEKLNLTGSQSNTCSGSRPPSPAGK